MSAAASRSTVLSELRRQLSPTQHQRAVHDALPSGLASLDALLPEGGFCPGCLIEWVAEPGAGAMSTALLAAAGLLEQPGILAVIDGQSDFSVPAAVSAGVRAERLLIIRPEDDLSLSARSPNVSPRIRRKSRAGTKTLWALEQALRSRAARIVLCRLPDVPTGVMRRLQLAAENGGSIGFLVRPKEVLRQTSWANARFVVRATASPPVSQRTVEVRLVRCRNAVDRTGVAQLTMSAPEVMPVSAPAAGQERAP